jgi:hypothetical protein
LFVRRHSQAILPLPRAPLLPISQQRYAPESRLRRDMAMIVTTAIAALVWMVLWALGAKPIDATLVAAVILLVGVGQRMMSAHLPGAKKSD